MAMIRLALWVVIALAAVPAAAGERFESWSPVTHAPAGPLTAAQARKLPRWLDVERKGDGLDITFRPERRVRWIVTMGPDGPVSKRTEVDGAVWTTSAFTYRGGKLATKTVTGPGVVEPIVFTYRYDGTSTIRTATRGPEKLVDEWTLVQTRAGWTATARVDGAAVREDHLDASGRLVSTSTMGRAPLEIVFDRNKDGSLRGVRRRIDGKLEPARTARPRKDLTSAHVREINGAFERHEVLLLIGPPITHSIDGRGVERTAQDSYTDDCWLNKPSGVRYDAADKVSGTHQACICGFCVATPATAVGELLGQDEHWTQGPWLSVNGVVVTGSHELATPDGPREASTLREGDMILDAHGTPIRLREVRSLPPGLRLGRNLRTSSGTFSAGGLLFHAEPACPPR